VVSKALQALSREKASKLLVSSYRALSIAALELRVVKDSSPKILLVSAHACTGLIALRRWESTMCSTITSASASAILQHSVL
jgi:hypothetical protein